MVKKIASLLVVFSSLMLISCKNEIKGFNLQKFNVVNSKLINTIHFVDSIRTVDFSKKTIVLEFKVSDSNPEFWFSFQDSTLLRDYIYRNNFRIVGYLDNGDRQIVLLSDIDNITEFELRFFGFVSPTNEHKIFRYIEFPENQYRLTENGSVFPPTAKEYGYLIFTYKDKDFLVK